MTKTRLFFATDIHGSERCFLKFINAGKFYKADVLVLGGDITGKMLIPIVEKQDGSFNVSFQGKNYVLRSKEEVGSMEENIRAIGYYPYRITWDKVEDLTSDKEKLDAIFSRLMCESVEEWVKIAEERLRGTGIKCLISAGNDDGPMIDPILEGSDCITHPEGKTVMIDDHHEMISCGYANITPWRCPRDIPEEELLERIEVQTLSVKNMENCLFNLHCPPFNTTIDLAPKLDEELRPVLQPGGGVLLAPAGSKAVRTAIERHQPLLGLHGHIHEAKGLFKIGRTLCFNPGSEYSEGILRGLLVDLTEKGIKDFLLISG